MLIIKLLKNKNNNIDNCKLNNFAHNENILYNNEIFGSRMELGGGLTG